MTAAVELPAPDVVVELRDVAVRRGTATLLHGVDWTVRAGERWVVLGPNGAGKTTLLTVATGMTDVSSGSRTLLGEPVDAPDTDIDDLLPRVGWASAALADRLPAAERVLDVVLTASFAAVRRGHEQYDDVDVDRARDLLTHLGCRGLVDRRFGTLSEGERKRVQLARSLMTDPELLVLDEPAAGLDLGGREALVRMLARLAHDPDAPVQVLVSHHVEEIPPGFTHALLLRDGHVVAAGEVAEVLTSSHLSATFGLPLKVTRSNGRITARAALHRL